MNLRSTLVALVVAVGVAGRPQFGSTDPSSLASILATAPACAIPCLAITVNDSTCKINNTPCMCTDKVMESQVFECIAASCSFADVLGMRNRTALACDAPVQDKSSSFNIMTIVLSTVAILLVLVRLVFQQFFSLTKRLAADDLLLLLVVFLHVALVVVSIRGLTGNGMGTDIWTVQPDDLTAFFRAYYVAEVLYFAEVALINICFAIYFVNVFPDLAVRPLLWATAIFNLLYGLAFVFAAIFQCTPVSYYWTQYMETSSGQCVNVNALGYANAAFGIAIYLWLMAVALSQVRKCSLDGKDKVAVAIMLLVGIFVTVASIVRLSSLVNYASSSNMTWDSWMVVCWAVIQLTFAIICACLPAIRLILQRLFPKYLDTSAAHGVETTGKEDTSLERWPQLSDRTSKDSVLEDSGKSGLDSTGSFKHDSDADVRV
ncbi:hypothetical protein RJ55_07550 [Drechmeria coniospora]|nr:hypothetical protein RJ55_07550 [Drechmeria coniospora]